MLRRSVRRYALAALPMVVLSQCAPQCAPPPPPAPSPTTTLPPPPPAWFRQTTDVTPAGQSGIDFVQAMSRDGRRVNLDLIAGSGRLDVATRALVALPLRGELTQDGSALIGLTDDPSPSVVRHDLATGRDTTYQPPPLGWSIDSGYGVSINDSGRHVGVVAHHAALADSGAFALDTATGVWTRPDQDLGVDGSDNSSWTQLFSADGSVAVFEYVNGPIGCEGCTALWLSGPSGRSLLNPSWDGGMPTTGESWLLDMSSDGRFVLFGSTSTDLAGAGGWADGRLYIRDVATGGTRVVSYDDAYPALGSVSDDGRVVAYITDEGMPRVSVDPGTPNWFSIPASPSLNANDAIHPFSAIELAGNGTRVAYTNTEGRVLISDFLSTGR